MSDDPNKPKTGEKFATCFVCQKRPATYHHFGGVETCSECADRRLVPRAILGATRALYLEERDVHRRED